MAKVLVLDEEKAATVKRIFELRNAKLGFTLKKITDMLNAEGYTTKESKPFHHMPVKRILDSQAVYEGRYKYSGIEAAGRHSPII